MFVGRCLALMLVSTVSLLSVTVKAETSDPVNYDVARWNEIHFSPAIEQADNEDCLACHSDILDRTVRDVSPAGFSAGDSFAWYQTLSTYTGSQDTFHNRHLGGEFASQVMDLKCTTCHNGNDPREEASISSANGQADLTMRKQVDPYVCLMCHGVDNYKIMGMPGPWFENRNTFQNNCLLCHAGIRLERHKGVSFLKAEEIEALGKENADVCYGCHGGRAWYATNFPYLGKKWPGHGPVPLGLRDKYSK